MEQLSLSERHLDSLLVDTTSALDLLATLSESFKNVEAQTTAFQAQCEDLLDEQKRLKSLADEVEEDLQYYSYLEPITRRLNAPGSGRLVRGEGIVEILEALDNCIDFMSKRVSRCFSLPSEITADDLYSLNIEKPRPISLDTIPYCNVLSL